MTDGDEVTLEQMRHDAQSRMQDQLDHWKNRIQALQVMLENASIESRTELHLALIELRKLEDSGRAYVISAEKTAASTWESTKTEIAEGWSQFSGAFETIWNQIRNHNR